MAYDSEDQAKSALHGYDSNVSSAPSQPVQFTHQTGQRNSFIKGADSNQPQAAPLMGTFHPLSSEHQPPWFPTSAVFQDYGYGNLQPDFSRFANYDINQMHSKFIDSRVTDRFETFHNTYGRKQKRNKSTQPFRNIINIPTNFSRDPRQGYQGWNHYEPNFDWYQTKVQRRKTKTASRNLSRYKTSDELDKLGLCEHPFPPRRRFTNTVSSTSTSRSSSASGNGNKTVNQVEITKSQVNLNVGSMNSESAKQQNNEDDDITYLFTVDSSSKEQMVLEIDLQSQAMNLVSTKNTIDIIDLEKDSKIIGVKTNQSNTVKTSQATSASKSRKRKLPENEVKTNKRTSHQPKCSVCGMNYDDIIGKDDNMYISSNCSHIFCRSCISKNGKSNVCPTCGIKFLTFRRLFL